VKNLDAEIIIERAAVIAASSPDGPRIDEIAREIKAINRKLYGADAHLYSNGDRRLLTERKVELQVEAIEIVRKYEGSGNYANQESRMGSVDGGGKAGGA